MATKKEEQIDIITIKQEKVTFFVLGESPLIFNRLSEKAQRQLLCPPEQKNKAERATTAKHNPLEEFRASPNTLLTGETLLALPATAFKGALRSVAIDMPGATKAQLGRLTYVDSEMVQIFGVPKLLMSPVRNAGINKTPDIRSRAILPEWAAVVTIKYTTPMINLTAVSSLFAAAGTIIGVGDWRPEKGSGSYGRFQLVNEDDADFLRIVSDGGRKVQESAMRKADPYNTETEELLAWFDGEVGRRGLVVAT